MPPLCREAQSLGQQMLNAPLGINGLTCENVNYLPLIYHLIIYQVYHYKGEFANVIERARASEISSFIVQQRDLGVEGAAPPPIEISENIRGIRRSDFYEILGERGWCIGGRNIRQGTIRPRILFYFLFNRSNLWYPNLTFGGPIWVNFPLANFRGQIVRGRIPVTDILGTQEDLVLSDQ